MCVEDIAADNPNYPNVVKITIKKSETDAFHQGVDLFIGRTGTDICLVVPLLKYLVTRGMVPGPLFLLRDGIYLTRQSFVKAARQA